MTVEELKNKITATADPREFYQIKEVIAEAMLDDFGNAMAYYELSAFLYKTAKAKGISKLEISKAKLF